MRELVTEKLPLGEAMTSRYAPSVALPLGLAMSASGLLWAASESSAVWSCQRSSRPGCHGSLPGFRAAGLVSAVVHDGNAGMEGTDNGAGVGQIHTVVGNKVEVDRADGVGWDT